MDIESVLFCRIGWMRFYRNVMPGDEQLVGGGSFNDEDIGSEVANFLPWKGRMYGFAQPAMGAANRIALERIVPMAKAGSISGVLAVFVARHPGEGKQRIVGWYRNATVRREPLKNSPHPRGKGRWHNVLGRSADAVLLPVSRRTHVIPAGAGAMGQSNVYYSREPDGALRNAKWMQQAVAYVDAYDGPNLVRDPTVEEEEALVDRMESIEAAAQGQGFAQNPRERRAIESRAMRRAKQYFKDEFTEVEDVSAKRSYDLHCSGADRTLKVEVKGTTGLGNAIILTRREVELARKGLSALFVLHSITLKNGKASGGVEKVVRPWHIKVGKLRPICYTYQLNE